MSTQPRHHFHPEIVPANVPIWRELYIGIDWAVLHYSPVYYGIGVPRGDGSAVVVVPGFLATDFYLQELYYWLMRVGYRPYLSKIGRNADCIDRLVRRLSETVEKAHAETGGKVHIIGHSLGGILARAVAVLKPDIVASVITMGSPFRGIRSHPFVLQMSNYVRERIKVEGRNKYPQCFGGECTCDAYKSLQGHFPHHIPQSAIYTKTDGIVDWRACISHDPKNNFEVVSTHGGLAFNPFTYRTIGKLLSERKAK
jgi:pimeloyl-ACP methyl ester carboxylesterase